MTRGAIGSLTEQVGRYHHYFANAGWLVGAGMTRQAMALIFMVVLVRAVPPDTVGQYQLIVAAIAMGGIATLPGLSRALVQTVARGNLGAVRRITTIHILASVLGGAALVAYGLTLDDPGMRIAAIYAGILFPTSFGMRIWTALQEGQSRFAVNAKIQAGVAILSYSAMIGALLVDIKALVWLVVIPHTLWTVINIVLVARMLRACPPSGTQEDGVIDYGLQTSAYEVVNIVGNQADKFLLFFFLSPEALAIFVIAERVPELMKKYTQMVLVVLIPGFAQRKEYTQDLHKKLLRVSFLVIAVLGAFAFGVVPWLVPLAFTEAYADSVQISQLLIGTLAIGTLGQFRYVYLRSRLDASAVRSVVLWTNLIRISASCIAIPAIGVWGAVVATALYRVSLAIVANRAIQRYLPK